MTDFGLARLAGAEATSEGPGAPKADREPRGTHAELTRTGMAVGTPAYMAPERGRRRAHRSVRVLRDRLRGALRRAAVRGRLAAYNCVTTCADAACLDQCEATFPDGISDVKALIACINDSCQSECGSP